RHGSSRCPLEEWPLRPNVTPRRVVGFSSVGVPRPGHVSCLRQLGRLAKQPLHLWALPLTFLLARAFRRLSTRLVRAEAFVVSELPALLAGASDSLDPRPVPADLLLLPRRILQIVLGRSSRLLGGRATTDVSGRTNSPADPPKLPPLLLAALLPGMG